MKVFIAILFFVSVVFNAARLNGQTYSVKKISPGSINVNGKGNAVAWSSANVLTNFTYPWESETAAAIGLAPAIFGPLMNITGSILASYWHRYPPPDNDAHEDKISLKEAV